MTKRPFGGKPCSLGTKFDTLFDEFSSFLTHLTSFLTDFTSFLTHLTSFSLDFHGFEASRSHLWL